MTAAPAPAPDPDDVNPEDAAVQEQYMEWLWMNCAGEILLNKDSLLTAMEKQYRWTDFLADMAARRR